MFVCEGARRKLVASERAKFLNQEWPAMLSRIEQLGLSVTELLAESPHKESESR
jgi:GntR family transcriptional regulator